MDTNPEHDLGQPNLWCSISFEMEELIESEAHQFSDENHIWPELLILNGADSVVGQILTTGGELHVAQQCLSPGPPSEVAHDKVWSENSECAFSVDDMTTSDSLTSFDGEPSLGLSSPVTRESYKDRAPESVVNSIFQSSSGSSDITHSTPIFVEPAGPSDSGIRRKFRRILPRPEQPPPENVTSPQIPIVKGLDEKRKNKPRSRNEKKRSARSIHCHVCPETFSCKKDSDRHYIGYHPHEAFAMGLPILFFCPIPGCEKTYGRGDRVTRHLTNKHGRPKLR